MVGHTHDDIDQMFSRFSTALKFSEASVVYSVSELMKVIELSFSPTPHVVFLTEMYDWKSELDKFSTHVLGSHPVHGHCRPLQYLVHLQSLFRKSNFNLPESSTTLYERGDNLQSRAAVY